MQILLTLLCCLLGLNGFAQSVPFSINYQAVARDANGMPIANANIDALINILQGDASGPVVFSETHDAQTNAFGIYMFLIGEGNGSDDLRTIAWADDEYYVETIIQINGGEELTSVSRLNSVPYALTSYRSVIDEVEDADSDPHNELQELSLHGNELTLTNGNSVDLSAIAGADETVTEILLNHGGNSIDYIDENGVTTSLNLCNVVHNCETITSLRWNSTTNSLEYTNEDGSMDVIELTDIPISGEYEETLTELSYNTVTNSLEYKDENGVTNIISIPAHGLVDETTTTLSLNHNFTSIDYVDEDGVTTNLDLCHVVGNCESLTSFRYNPHENALEYIDEEGTLSSVSLTGIEITGSLAETITTLTDNGDGTFTYISEDGTLTIISETTSHIGLSTDNQSIEFIDEDGVTTALNMCAAVDSCETVTSLTLSTTGQLVYQDEEGSINLIDINNIREEDPEDASKMITYAPLSGSEQAIFERGTTQLNNGEAVIHFSDHFKKLMALNTMTVSLTPHSADTYGLAVIEKTANGITVKELMKGQSNFSFDWEVKATRKSGLTHQVIQSK